MSFDSIFISLIIILGIIFLIILDRRNIEFKYILIIRRWKKGIKYIDKISKPKNFWKIFGSIAIIFSIILVIYGIFVLLDTAIKITLGEIKGFTGGIVVPAPTAQPTFLPGIIFIPFWFWIILIPFLIIPHEIMHGILARVERIKIKSFGFFLLAIFPGAFVEPDEKKFKKLKPLSKLRIIASGSFANILVALAIFLPFFNFGILPNIIWPAFVKDGIEIVEVNETSPARVAGLEKGMIIEKINGKDVKINFEDYLKGNFIEKYFKDLKNRSVIFETNKGTYFVYPEFIRMNGTEIPRFGIGVKIIISNEKLFFSFILPFFLWLWVLSIAIAIINLLPIYPLDGGKIFEVYLEKIVKKRKNVKTILKISTFLTLFLIFFVLFGPHLF